MNRVFLLQHLHLLNDDEEDVKTLGIYSSRGEALAAVERLRLMPGFVGIPNMADPSLPESSEGFYIDEYELNQDSWAEGFVTA